MCLISMIFNHYDMFEYVMGGHLYLSALHCAECMQYDMAVNEGTDILSL